MNNLGMLVNKKFLTLLLTTESAEFTTSLNSSLELALFLIEYAFLTDPDITSETILKRQNPSHEELFFKNFNGARYLDPKYSRWLSTDPALSSYVEKNYEGPSGGIYNSVNLNLYHYGGNNPIKYVDPDGRRDMTAEEKQFATEILGNKAPLNTRVYQNFTDAGSFSSPTGFVLIRENLYSDSMKTSSQLSEMMHELYHQVQYTEDETNIKISLKSLLFSGPGVGSLKLRLLYSIEAHGSFPKLIIEFIADKLMRKFSDNKTVYDYGDLSKCKRLSDLPFLESQAAMIEDFSYYYHKERYGLGITDEQKIDMKIMAEIMQNSGIKSEATEWVLEKF